MLSVQFVIEPGRAVPRASLCDTWVHCTRLFVCWQAGRPTMKYVYVFVFTHVFWLRQQSVTVLQALSYQCEKQTSSFLLRSDRQLGRSPSSPQVNIHPKACHVVRKSLGGRSSVPLNT